MKVLNFLLLISLLLSLINFVTGAKLKHKWTYTISGECLRSWNYGGEVYTGCGKCDLNITVRSKQVQKRMQNWCPVESSVTSGYSSQEDLKWNWKYWGIPWTWCSERC